MRLEIVLEADRRASRTGLDDALRQLQRLVCATNATAKVENGVVIIGLDLEHHIYLARGAAVHAGFATTGIGDGNAVRRCNGANLVGLGSVVLEDQRLAFGKRQLVTLARRHLYELTSGIGVAEVALSTRDKVLDQDGMRLGFVVAIAKADAGVDRDGLAFYQ